MSRAGLTERARQIAGWVKQYRYFLTIGIIVILFGFTVWRIDYLSSTQRDEQTYEEQLSTVEKIRFNKAVIERILELRDAGVNVKPSYPGNRTNPFE